MGGPCFTSTIKRPSPKQGLCDHEKTFSFTKFKYLFLFTTLLLLKLIKTQSGELTKWTGYEHNFTPEILFSVHIALLNTVNTSPLYSIMRLPVTMLCPVWIQFIYNFPNFFSFISKVTNWELMWNYNTNEDKGRRC